MTIRAHLKNGENVDLKYGSTWRTLMWSLQNYGALIGDGVYISGDLIARIERL